MKDEKPKLTVIPSSDQKAMSSELMDEIRKCKVLCKNCHVIETFRDREMHNSWNTYRQRKNIQIAKNTLENYFV